MYPLDSKQNFYYIKVQYLIQKWIKKIISMIMGNVKFVERL